MQRCARPVLRAVVVCAVAGFVAGAGVACGGGSAGDAPISGALADGAGSAGAAVPAPSEAEPAAGDTAEPSAAASTTTGAGVLADAGPGAAATTTTTTQPVLEKERPWFEDAAAPRRPFAGLVHLWYDIVGPSGWVLRYWSWDEPAELYPQVPLDGLDYECLGQMAMLVHAERGVEIGSAETSSNETGGGEAGGVLRVPWGGTAGPAGEPSGEFLAWAEQRPSNVEVSTEGDWVRIGSGAQQRSYAMRSPARPDGQRWRVQARHDGALFVLTVHPAHLPCYSGVTWISVAGTGEFATCGASTAATAFVAPPQQARGELVLPDPDTMPTYLSCAPELNLRYLPFTQQRQLVKR